MSKLFRRFTKTARDSQDLNQKHGPESERPVKAKAYRSKPGNREPEVRKSTDLEVSTARIPSLSQDSMRVTNGGCIDDCKQAKESIKNLESRQMQKLRTTKSFLSPFVPTVCDTMTEASVSPAPSCEATVQSSVVAATNGHNARVERVNVTKQASKQPRIPQNQIDEGTGTPDTRGYGVVTSRDQGPNITKVQTQQQSEVSVCSMPQASTVTGGVAAATADPSANSIDASPDTYSVSQPPNAGNLGTKQGTMPNSSLVSKPRQSSAFQIRNPETGEVVNSGKNVPKPPKPPTHIQTNLVPPGLQPNGKVQQTLLIQAQPNLGGGHSQVVVLQAPVTSSPLQFQQLAQAPLFLQTQQPVQMVVQQGPYMLQQQQQTVQLQVVPHLILQQQPVQVPVRIQPPLQPQPQSQPQPQPQPQSQPQPAVLAAPSVGAPNIELQQQASTPGNYMEPAPMEESNLVPGPSSSSSSASASGRCGVVMGTNTSTAVTVAQMSQCAQMLQQRLIYRQGALGGSSTGVVASATNVVGGAPGIAAPDASGESGASRTVNSVYAAAKGFSPSMVEAMPKSTSTMADVTRPTPLLVFPCARTRVQNRPLYANQILASLLEQQMTVRSNRLKCRKISNIPCGYENANLKAKTAKGTTGTTRPRSCVVGVVRAGGRASSTSTASDDGGVSGAAVTSATSATPPSGITRTLSSVSRGSEGFLKAGVLPDDVLDGQVHYRDREGEQKCKRRDKERAKKRKSSTPETIDATAPGTHLSDPAGVLPVTADSVSRCPSPCYVKPSLPIYTVQDLLALAIKSSREPPEEAGKFRMVDAGYGGRLGRFSHGTFHQSSTPICTSPQQPAPRRGFDRGRNASDVYFVTGATLAVGNTLGSTPAASSGNKWRKEGGPNQPKPLLYYQRDDIKPTTSLKSSRELTREEQFQREVRSLLNKLTVENFLTVAEKLAVLYESLELEQDVQVMVVLVHDKAITELDYSDMYADLAYLLKYRFNEKLDIGFKSTCFHRTLLNRCQVSFEEINHETVGNDATGTSSLPSKKWVLGNIRFMGELFLRKIISITILKQISKTLMSGTMSGTKHPLEHLTECFTELLTTIGYTMDQSLVGKEMLNDYMNILIDLKDANVYSVRINYRIQDLVELRAKNWQKKLFKEKATSVAQIHLEAQQEELRGGTIHVQQMGKYTTAGLQTSRHYSDYLVNQRKLAMTKIQDGVFFGTRDATVVPSSSNGTASCAGQVPDDSTTTADSTASMAPVDVVDRLVTLALSLPPSYEFHDAWKRLKPNIADAKEICRTLCHKATYAKAPVASSALAELAAHCITKCTSGKDSQVLWEMVGQEFLVRLRDEILDNPRAVGIFATLCMTVFETMPASNFLLLERMQMPQDRDTAKELCALVLRGIRSKGGQAQGPRRILQRCFAHSFSDISSVE